MNWEVNISHRGGFDESTRSFIGKTEIRHLRLSKKEAETLEKRLLQEHKEWHSTHTARSPQITCRITKLRSP